MSVPVSRDRSASAGAPSLLGWAVIVTRPAHQAEAIVGALEGHGASVLAVPAIAIADPDDGGARLRDAALRVSEFDWVVFTSENAVDRLFEAVGDAHDLDEVRIAAIGEGTAETLARHGITADLVPRRYIAEALVDAFPRREGGGRVLLPRAAVARDVVPEGLRQLGWEVDVVEAYRTVPAVISEPALARVRSADAITFTSSSTVLGFFHSARASDLPPVVASIGPITSKAARDAGIDVSVQAAVHTSRGLAEALAAFARTNPRPRRPPVRPS